MRRQANGARHSQGSRGFIECPHCLDAGIVLGHPALAQETCVPVVASFGIESGHEGIIQEDALNDKHRKKSLAHLR